jgi:radical SAM protein with 4Fe4S-binding SPASM domain
MLNEATKANLRRKSAYVDAVQMHEGKPLFSWLDLSLTELCNRSAGHKKACVFCPRIDPTFYPNQKLHMSLALAGKIADELRSLEYRGVVVLCGFGEPLLHPQLLELVSLFKGIRLEVVTNGDFLTPLKIAALSEAGVNYFVVSMYDGPEQIEKFTARFAEAGCTDYILRDRWHTEADDFGLKLTNRAGTVGIGQQDEIDTHRPCHYLTYQMTIDWNGDVLLCPQDWYKKVKFGNAAGQSLMEAWNSSAMHKRRLNLIEGKRCDAPCNGCNTDGTLHGYNHAPQWKPAIQVAAE